MKTPESHHWAGGSRCFRKAFLAQGDLLPRRRGVTLFDMIVAIGLISIFSVVAVKLIVTSMRVSNASVRSEDLGSSFDSAVGQLRRDVWSATGLQSPDAKNLHISRDGEPAVSWTIADDGTMTRAASETKRGWPKVGAGMTVKIDGPVVMLVEPDSSAIAARRIAVASRVMPAKARTP